VELPARRTPGGERDDGAVEVWKKETGSVSVAGLASTAPAAAPALGNLDFRRKIGVRTFTTAQP
jgi:hypothetical protein